MKSRVLVVDDDPALSEMLSMCCVGRLRHRCGVGRPRALPAVRELRLSGVAGSHVARDERHRRVPGDPRRVRGADRDAHREERHVDVVLGLESGADDYVIKPFSPRSCRPIGPAAPHDDEPAELLSWRGEHRRPAHQVSRSGQPSRSPVEFDLLVALARKPGRCSLASALEQVWGYRHARTPVGERARAAAAVQGGA